MQGERAPFICTYLSFALCHLSRQHRPKLTFHLHCAVPLDNTGQNVAKGGVVDYSIDPPLPARAAPVPFVPGAFTMSDVLSKSECAQLVAAAEACGAVLFLLSLAAPPPPTTRVCPAGMPAGGNSGSVWCGDRVLGQQYVLDDAIRSHSC
jgi:hypothetical protein